MTGNKKGKHIRLKGVLPESYEGDQHETQNFLMQFRRYILMNWGTEITKDPFKRCGLFLSLMKGPKVKGWVQKTYDWLDQVETNPDDKFLPGSNPWEILKGKFHEAFINYMEHEQAQDELTKLKMTGGDVDRYIASFEFLSYQAGMNPDEPSMQRLFACGLP
jgi:Retrotransposon gag protein